MVSNSNCSHHWWRVSRGVFPTFAAVISCAFLFSAAAARTDALRPVRIIRSRGELKPGAPLALVIDFRGNAYVADGSPGRILAMPGLDPKKTLEYEQPPGMAGFYPTSIGVRGFFLYAVDETSRRLLRYDDHGAFRDVLFEFDDRVESRRASPFGLAVDPTGRVAITDVENHQVVLIDNYLVVRLVFGSYGKFDGQFDTPRGVSFTAAGNLLVADTGNRRVQRCSDGGAFLQRIPARGDNPLKRPRRAVEWNDGRVAVADPVAGAVVVFGRDGLLVRAFAPPRDDGESGAHAPVDSSGGAQSLQPDDSFAPMDLAVGRDGALYVIDGGSAAIYVFARF